MRWAALPSVDPVAYGKETHGNVRFVLTHQGLRLYDEDFNLYYRWRRPAAAEPQGGDVFEAVSTDSILREAVR